VFVMQALSEISFVCVYVYVCVYMCVYVCVCLFVYLCVYVYADSVGNKRGSAPNASNLRQSSGDPVESYLKVCFF